LSLVHYALADTARYVQRPEEVIVRYAFISDVHGRVDSLRQFLALLRREAIDQIVTLGDIGNDDCYDLLRAHGAVGVFGNYEVSGHVHLSTENLAFALGLRPVFVEDGFLAAHAVPMYPAGLFSARDFSDYMRRTGASWRGMFRYPNDEDDSLFQIVEELQVRGKHLFFHGHTHRQQIWRILPDDRPRELHEARIALDPAALYIVGVGSLGRPEDGPSPRYAIYDQQRNEIELHSLNRSES
jgi:predicted phosphodiesterase